MTAELSDAARIAADRLMNALALHEDARDTVESALADLWEQAREPDGTCPVHGEEWLDSDPEPWCHTCVEERMGSVPALPTARSEADAAGWGEPRPTAAALSAIGFL